ncbi:MAG: hypothetical protein BAJATHORv1_20395 [Candidatus Thorarchaeota archaeon]|nr:MAG: hypothetical protein BAJATHORv1_20395 [Candidatus Thorarchaeota archaeon]
MSFKTRKFQEGRDWKNFVDLEFQTMKTLSDVHYQELVREHPDKTEEELIVAYGKSLKDEFDFGTADCQIFVAEDKDERYAGHVWVAIRNSEDSWDFERPVWIYDITIHPDFRRKGLGKQLMKQAEDWSRDMKRNIGLFVHHQNKPAISLYQNTGYHIKMIPLSKSLVDTERSDTVNLEFRRMENKDQSWLDEMGFRLFKKKVRFSKEIQENIILAKYQEVCKKIQSKEKAVRYIGVNHQDTPIAAIWISEAQFNQDFAYIDEILLDSRAASSQVQEDIFQQLTYAADDLGKEKIYILLHRADCFEWEIFQEHDFKVPGFFMEKRLI